METKTVDRRIRKTKRQLRAALVKLIAQKSVQEITVKELADTADINRGTFYIHYRDVYHLIEQTEQDLLEEFQQLVRTWTENPQKRNSYRFLIEIFSFFADNSEICIALIGKNGDIRFLEQLKNVVKSPGFREWILAESGIQPQDFAYCYEFIASGCVGLFQVWVENGMQEPPEAIARLTERLILQGIRAPLRPISDSGHAKA